MNWTSPHNRTLPARGETPLIMGILNVSTDSFSDGGQYFTVKAAQAHAHSMIMNGADIIDVGAESTRPGAVLLSMDEELKRLVPQLVSLRGRFPKTPISVDTYKPEVARAAVENGADIINDVNADMVGGKYPMAELAAELKCPLIIMHNSRDEKIEGDFFEGFMRGMEFRLEKALSAGMSKDQIVLDPGFGFGKTVDQNYEIVRRLGELRVFGCAILLGVSRKSSIVAVVGDGMQARDDATAAISAVSTFQNSSDILRVHDVEKNLNAVKTAAMLRK